MKRPSDGVPVPTIQSLTTGIEERTTCGNKSSNETNALSPLPRIGGEGQGEGAPRWPIE
jgi:hypothetical protein